MSGIQSGDGLCKGEKHASSQVQKANPSECAPAELISEWPPHFHQLPLMGPCHPYAVWMPGHLHFQVPISLTQATQAAFIKTWSPSSTPPKQQPLEEPPTVAYPRPTKRPRKRNVRELCCAESAALSSRLHGLLHRHDARCTLRPLLTLIIPPCKSEIRTRLLTQRTPSSSDSGRKAVPTARNSSISKVRQTRSTAARRRSLRVSSPSPIPASRGSRSGNGSTATLGACTRPKYLASCQMMCEPR